MDVNELRALIAVAEHGSLKAAARALDLDRSTLRRRLDALEARFEAPLIVRAQRGSELTQAGLEAVARARRIVEQTQGLLQVGRDALEPQGSVTLVATPGMPPPGLGDLGRFAAQTMPRVRFTIAEAEDPIGEADTADIMLHWSPGTPPAGWRTFELIEAPMRLFASLDYIERHGIPGSLAELLADHRILAWTAPGIPPSLVVDCDGKPHSFDPVTTSASPPFLFHMAAAGAGVALVVEGGYPIASLERDALVELLPGVVRQTRTLCVSYRLALEEDPRVAQLTTVIQAFAAQRSLEGAGNKNGYDRECWFSAAQPPG